MSGDWADGNGRGIIRLKGRVTELGYKPKLGPQAASILAKMLCQEAA